MGQVQQNVQRVPGTGRIAVEIPGIKDKRQSEKMLSTTAKIAVLGSTTNQRSCSLSRNLSKIVPAKADSLGVAKTLI